MRQPKMDDIVQIYWVDAGGTSGWVDLDDESLNALVPRVRSIGWFVKRTKDGYFLAEGRNCSEGFAPGVGVSFIPAGCVDKIEIIRSAPKGGRQ